MLSLNRSMEIGEVRRGSASLPSAKNLAAEQGGPRERYTRSVVEDVLAKGYSDSEAPWTINIGQATQKSERLNISQK